MRCHCIRRGSALALRIAVLNNYESILRTPKLKYPKHLNMLFSGVCLSRILPLSLPVQLGKLSTNFVKNVTLCLLKRNRSVQNLLSRENQQHEPEKRNENLSTTKVKSDHRRNL